MASEIKVDTISENTSANGVSIDSVQLKDGGILAASGIPLQVVTYQNIITASNTITSTSFTDIEMSSGNRLEIKITPKQSDSKIILIGLAQTYHEYAGYVANVRGLRDISGGTSDTLVQSYRFRDEDTPNNYNLNHALTYNFLDTPKHFGFRSPPAGTSHGHGVYGDRAHRGYSLSVLTGSFHTDSPTGYALALSGESGSVAQTGGSHAKLHYNGSSTSWTAMSASVAASVWARVSGSGRPGNLGSNGLPYRGSILGTNQNTSFLQVQNSSDAVVSFIQFDGGSHTFQWNNAASPARDGDWHHYVVAYDMSPAHDLANPASGSVSLYVDGKKFGDSYDVHKQGNNHGNGWLQGVGRDYGSSGQGYFPGDIADVRIYAYESGSAGMTAEEAKWLYLNPGEGGQIQGDPESNPRYREPNIGIGYRTVGAGPVMDDMVDGEMTDFRLVHTQTGTYNVGIGYQALEDATSAHDNIAIGYQALQSCKTGGGNVAIGYQALKTADHTRVDSNVMIGYRAGDSITESQYCTGIGAETSFDNDEDNQTAIGYGAAATDENDIAIGNTSVDSIKGQVDFGVYSDRRIKKNIIDNDLGLDFINDLKPRKFNKINPAEYPEEIRMSVDGKAGDWTDDQANKVWDGLIAQEVKEVVDKHESSFSGWDIQKNSKENIRYSTLTIPLIKAVQELTEIVKSQQEEIEKLKNQ